MELLTGENEDDGGDVIGGCWRLQIVPYFHTTTVIMAWGIRTKYHINGLHTARNNHVGHYSVPIEYWHGSATIYEETDGTVVRPKIILQHSFTCMACNMQQFKWTISLDTAPSRERRECSKRMVSTEMLNWWASNVHLYYGAMHW